MTGEGVGKKPLRFICHDAFVIEIIAPQEKI